MKALISILAIIFIISSCEKNEEIIYLEKESTQQVQPDINLSDSTVIIYLDFMPIGCKYKSYIYNPDEKMNTYYRYSSDTSINGLPGKLFKHSIFQIQITKADSFLFVHSFCTENFDTLKIILQIEN